MPMLTRRTLIAAVAMSVTTPSSAQTRFSVGAVEVRTSNIVASRIRTDLPGRIAALLRGRGSGRPVRLVVNLRTIDPFEAALRYQQRRGIAVEYQAIDQGTGRVIASSRFIERTRSLEDDEGTIRAFTRPITQGTQERDLARGVASQILRDLR